MLYIPPLIFTGDSKQYTLYLYKVNKKLGKTEKLNMNWKIYLMIKLTQIITQSLKRNKKIV